MAYTNKRLINWVAIIIMAVGGTFGCKEKVKPAPADTNSAAEKQTNEPISSASPPAAVATPTYHPDKPTLQSIVDNRRGWGPVYINWYGRQAPDFTVADLTGKTHTLSSYKGRNVMLIFWATWCNPCKQEIPNLIKLRNTIKEDKLAMLAISYIGPMNSTEMVREFVAANPVINYTVISADDTAMPAPYNAINSIPTTFFIDPDGRIKIVAAGVINVSQIKAILEAER
jgi:peroxiredoxin